MQTVSLTKASPKLKEKEDEEKKTNRTTRNETQNKHIIAKQCNQKNK